MRAFSALSNDDVLNMTDNAKIFGLLPSFTRQRPDFGLILLISNMVIHRSFTSPIHLLSANIRGTASFAMSDMTFFFISVNQNL